MKERRIFISYRNTIVDGKSVNYKLLSPLTSVLKEQYPTYEFVFLPPEMIRHGTLFSPYDIAKFIWETFILIDSCDKFVILDKDYFNECGELTSIWTEAEYCIWCYYSRKKGMFNRDQSKDSYYTIAKVSEDGFILSKSPLYSLSNWQRMLLKTCAIDFDGAAIHGIRATRSYMRTMRNLLVVCENCKKIYTADAKKLDILRGAEANCVCGNSLKFWMENKRWICDQSLRSSIPKRINVFDALGQLYEKEPGYEELGLK